MKIELLRESAEKRRGASLTKRVGIPARAHPGVNATRDVFLYEPLAVASPARLAIQALLLLHLHDLHVSSRWTEDDLEQCFLPTKVLRSSIVGVFPPRTSGIAICSSSCSPTEPVAALSYDCPFVLTVSRRRTAVTKCLFLPLREAFPASMGAVDSRMLDTPKHVVRPRRGASRTTNSSTSEKRSLDAHHVGSSFKGAAPLSLIFAATSCRYHARRERRRSWVRQGLRIVRQLSAQRFAFAHRGPAASGYSLSH